MLDEKNKQTNEKEDIKPFSFSRKKKLNSFSLDSVLSMKVCGAFQRGETNNSFLTKTLQG